MTELFQTIHRFETTTSTNDEAIRAAREGAPEGQVFVADLQTAGRGRAGRRWETPPGKNLAVSFLLRPSLPAAEASRLTLVAGAAIHETLSALLDPPLAPELKIKWPNDVILGGKKVAGILAESASGGETKEGRIPWVVLGIGIDVNADEEDFSPEVRKGATSLKLACGHTFDRESVFDSLLKAFERRYRAFGQEGFAPIRDYVQTHGYLNGKQVHAAEGSLTVTGTVTGLSEDGALLLRTEGGQIVSILAGDVRVSR